MQTCQKWETYQVPSIHVSTFLVEIVHGLGKKGVDGSRIIEKQLARLGLNCFDATADTGDGGGNNEGRQRVHA